MLTAVGEFIAVVEVEDPMEVEVAAFISAVTVEFIAALEECIVVVTAEDLIVAAVEDRTKVDSDFGIS